LSVGRRVEGQRGKWSSIGVEDNQWRVIRRLSLTVRARREAISKREGRWFDDGSRSKGLVPWPDAVQRIADRNGYEGSERRDMIRSLGLLLRETPRHVLDQSSVRHLGDGRYLSVNAGNHLLFRVPAYTDGGERQDADSFVIWPLAAPVSGLLSKARRHAQAFRFRLFPAENLVLSFGQILGLDSSDWRQYASACEEALACRRTRSWPTNVELPGSKTRA
jgi:hypothetical protein